MVVGKNVTKAFRGAILSFKSDLEEALCKDTEWDLKGVQELIDNDDERVVTDAYAIINLARGVESGKYKILQVQEEEKQ